MQVYAEKSNYNVGFQEKRHFSNENCRKSPKSVIITLAPGERSF
jgi:hypothetical protein